jgi:hypothetical protein
VYTTFACKIPQNTNNNNIESTSKHPQMLLKCNDGIECLREYVGDAIDNIKIALCEKGWYIRRDYFTQRGHVNAHVKCNDMLSDFDDVFEEADAMLRTFKDVVWCIDATVDVRHRDFGYMGLTITDDNDLSRFLDGISVNRIILDYTGLF